MNEVFSSAYYLPGMVMMWTNVPESPPTGWFPCDGATYDSLLFSLTNSPTPDLRDKFIKGAISQSNIGDLGGSRVLDVTGSPVVVGPHKLTTEEIPAHAHSFEAYGIGGSASRGSSASQVTNPDTSPYVTGENLDGDSPHTHAGSYIDNVSFDNQPEFTTLLYIVFMGADAVVNTPAPPFEETPLNPVCNWSYVNSDQVNWKVQFTDESTDPNGGAISSRLWTFGDGGSSIEINPSHVFPGGGTYTTSLTVETTTSGVSTTTTRSVLSILRDDA